MVGVWQFAVSVRLQAVFLMHRFVEVIGVPLLMTDPPVLGQAVAAMFAVMPAIAQSQSKQSQPQQQQQQPDQSSQQQQLLPLEINKFTLSSEGSTEWNLPSELSGLFTLSAQLASKFSIVAGDAVAECLFLVSYSEIAIFYLSVCVLHSSPECRSGFCGSAFIVGLPHTCIGSRVVVLRCR